VNVIQLEDKYIQPLHLSNDIYNRVSSICRVGQSTGKGDL